MPIVLGCFSSPQPAESTRSMPMASPAFFKATVRRAEKQDGREDGTRVRLESLVPALSLPGTCLQSAVFRVESGYECGCDLPPLPWLWQAQEWPTGSLPPAPRQCRRSTLHTDHPSALPHLPCARCCAGCCGDPLRVCAAHESQMGSVWFPKWIFPSPSPESPASPGPLHLDKFIGKVPRR